jgi:hypothetical protein
LDLTASALDARRANRCPVSCIARFAAVMTTKNGGIAELQRAFGG